MPPVPPGSYAYVATTKTTHDEQNQVSLTY